MEEFKSDCAEAMYNGSVEAMAEDYHEVNAENFKEANGILLMDQDLDD